MPDGPWSEFQKTDRPPWEDYGAGNLQNIPLDSPPSIFSGEYSGPTGTVAPGESLPRAATRQIIGGIGRAASTITGGIFAPENTPPEAPPFAGIFGPITDIAAGQYAQGKQAVELARQGRYSEAAGHGLAAALPILGPMVASATERAQTGTLAPAAELATYAAAPEVVKKAASLIPETKPETLAKAGKEKIFRAAAPTGTNVQFRQNLDTAAGDLAEIGKKIDLSQSAGGILPSSPDLRVRAAVNAIDEHTAEMYQQERLPQIQRNAVNPVVPEWTSDAKEGLKYLTRSAGDTASRSLAANALNSEAIPLAQADQLARLVNKELIGFQSMTPAERAATTMTNRRLSSLKALDNQLTDVIGNELENRGEAGIQAYEKRMAALKNVRNTLESRQNMSELQRHIPGLEWLKALTSRSVAGASQAATANVNIGRSLQRGFEQLAKSGIQAERPVGKGAPPIRGFLAPPAPELPQAYSSGPGYGLSVNPADLTAPDPNWLIDQARRLRPELSREQIMDILSSSREQAAGLAPETTEPGLPTAPYIEKPRRFKK